MTIKSLCLVVVVCISTSAALAAPTKDRHADKKKTTAKGRPAAGKTQGITPFRYVAGGALSILPGFGLGHMVQGRWFNDYGWVFTAGQVASILSVFSNVTRRFCLNLHLSDDDYDSCERENERKDRRQNYWAIAFALFKLGEIAHAWWPSKLAPLQQRQANPDAAVIPRHRYLWGGALGTTVGFGLGHAVQGRWWTRGRGWAYTITQLPIIAAIYSLAAKNSCEDRARAKERERRHKEESWGCPNPIGEDTAGLMIATFVISKIIEIFNVWDIDYNQHRVADTDKHNSLLLLPYVDNRGLGLQLAFSH